MTIPIPMMFDSPRMEQHSDAETETQSNYAYDRNEGRSPPDTPRMCCGECPCNCVRCPCGDGDQPMSDFRLYDDDDAQSYISDNGDEGTDGRHEEDDQRTWHGYTYNNDSDASMTASMTAEPSSGEASWYSSMAQSYASIDDLALQDLNHEQIYTAAVPDHDHIYISTILRLLPVDGAPYAGNQPPP